MVEKGMLASWQEGQEPEEYARGYEQVYRMGQEGIDEKYVRDSQDAQGMTEAQKQAAYTAGKESRNGENYLRQGQEWNDRANDGSTAQTVAEGTAGEEGSRPGTEGEAGRNVPGKLTSAAELGIPGGSTKQTLRVRSEDRYTEADRKAVAYARENGLECVLVEGDRIYTFDEEGEGKHYTKARAVIAGDKMFIQADDREFNSHQLARHEAGHRQLDSGKVSRAEVRQQLRQRYTEAQIDDICGLYAAAYGDSGMTAEEIFDEILCDAMGEMNAFATEGQEKVAGAVGLFLRDVARAEENSRTEDRDTETENHHKGAKFSIVVDDQKRVYSLQEVEDNIVTVSNMKPITEISSSAFSMEGKRLVDNVTEFFKSIGGKVESKDIGTVELSQKGIKSDIGHGMGPEKAASFAALPEVIKEGRIVDWQENWKERRYDTAVIAAPFTMDGTEYMMGVVVKQTGNGNKFYVHEVMTIKDGESPFITRVGNNADSPGGDSPSVNSVLQKILDVKRNLKDGNGAQFSREMATMADLKEENKHLKERVEFWKEQAHPSKGARANKQDVHEAAKQLKNA